MARVLCISSQTVFGPVGNSAAVPALQEMGHEVMALPTVVLSNHPGHGKHVGQATPAPLLAQMLQTLDSLGALKQLDGVMTGYFANADQVLATARQIASHAKLNQGLHVLVDPVIGDHGKLYVAEEVAAAIRDHLLPLATITTPNLFELGWLTGQSDIADAVAKLAVAETVVTSVPSDDDMLATQLHVRGQAYTRFTPRLQRVPNGTGDFLAGAYLARRLNQPPSVAFEGATERLEQAIARSSGRVALDISRTPSA